MKNTSDGIPEREMIIGTGGFQLSVWAYETPAVPHALLCLVHGQGEHSGRYLAMARHLSQRGIVVVAYDQRGHGLSEGLKGGPSSEKVLLEDLGYFLMHTRAQYNDLPLFLFGHSMGGNLVSNYLIADRSREVSGAIISSAWFELAVDLHPLVEVLGRWAGKFLPFVRAHTRIRPEQLTADPVRAEEIRNDPLARHTIPVGLYRGLVATGKQALRQAHLIDVPLLVTHGTADSLTSYEASCRFAENAGEKARFHPWEAQLHEPHQDAVKEEAYDLYTKWIQEIVGRTGEHQR